jgi:hypothetical protein
MKTMTSCAPSYTAKPFQCRSGTALEPLYRPRISADPLPPPTGGNIKRVNFRKRGRTERKGKEREVRGEAETLPRDYLTDWQRSFPEASPDLEPNTKFFFVWIYKVEIVLYIVRPF